MSTTHVTVLSPVSMEIHSLDTRQVNCQYVMALFLQSIQSKWSYQDYKFDLLSPSCVSELVKHLSFGHRDCNLTEFE